MYYCSLECAEQDRARFHDGLECCFYTHARERMRTVCILNTARLILRLYFALADHPLISNQSCTLHDGRTRCLNDLLSHVEHIVRDEKRMRLFVQIRNTLDQMQIAHDQQKLFELFGKTFINAFTIFDNSYGKLIDVGRGLYLEASVFDHSCKPNAIYSFAGIDVQVRANRLIDTDQEPIYINYLNANVSRKERRVYLQRQYYFMCRCELCREEDRFETTFKPIRRVARNPLIRRLCSIFYY